MTDSYHFNPNFDRFAYLEREREAQHFRIEPEPRAEVPKFRVGGHYRQNNGVVVKLVEFKPGLALADRIFCPPGGWLNSGGARRLSDGLYPGALKNAEYNCHLIPGELVQRDGQWVPADTIGPFGSGASLKTAGDKIVGRVKSMTPTLDKLEASKEPDRAPLPHFNQRTEFDPFKGFYNHPDARIRSSYVGFVTIEPEPNPDALPANVNLLRG